MPFSSPQTLMIQGCTSDAGKSVVTAGICRALANRGISVAPFKPQNMALNSAVTEDGGEIGRAQALQAHAARVAASIDMNPVLIKPNSDTGAQVIVHGKAVGNMEATVFHQFKPQALKYVTESHARLAERYDWILVEGAGSPAEINLRDKDIANMGFAEAVDCPVIIIADIDKGGVFAHLVGTLELLSESEQQRVVGFIINKFRGDVSLLEPGLRWLEERTNKPVLGVLPFLHGLHLDAEDAITTMQALDNERENLRVVVPVLPRISNHTDFDALRMHPLVDFNYVDIRDSNVSADLIILPGSKSVMGDLQALFEHGWQESIERHLRYGGKLLGICGGYQMLGEQILDPDHVESNVPAMRGLSLLPVATTLAPDKQLKRVEGSLNSECFAGDRIVGYEIHCGVTSDITEESQLIPFAQISSGGLITNDGSVSVDRQICGSYLHGMFDDAGACAAILSWAGLKDQDSTETRHVDEVREEQLDRLADSFESNLSTEFWARFE
ncbi:MAG: cobyric acid synthase [Pseudomonadota bacterium]